MKRGLWTILIALLVILWVFLLCLIKDNKGEPEMTPVTENELRLMRYHGVDVLLVDWNGNIFIERNGKRIKVGRE